MDNYPSAYEHSAALAVYLDEEVANGHMLKTMVGAGPTPQRVCPIGFIPKPEPGKFRLITDASAPTGHSTNSVNVKAGFRMVTPSDVFARCAADYWAAKSDVLWAFRNLPLRPDHAGLLAVEHAGYYYWDLRCPFGWTMAPFTWCGILFYSNVLCP